MRTASLLVVVAALLACASPERRIKANQALFDTYPPQVQQDIRDGKVEVGFDAAQVEMALGRPDRVYSRQTADSLKEVWAYGEGGGPAVGFGFGMGGGRMGYGVGVASGGDAPQDRIRLVFENGRVASIELKQ
jgi:hypothetical protein